MNIDVIIESVKRQSTMALFDGWILAVMTSGSFLFAVSFSLAVQ